MRTYRKLAFVATLATFVVIFAGGLVRVSGAGLGCPDWPKCFGSWIPPTSVEQLPPDIDPMSFNFTLAWIEYVNRLAGVILGLLILATAIASLLYHRKNPRILWPSVAAALLVAFQGWQGSKVVSSLLDPLAVSMHFGIALIIAALLIIATLEAYYLEFPQAPRGSESTRSLRIGLGILALIGLAQAILGAGVRGHVENILREFPLYTNSDALEHVGILEHTHLVLGVIVVLGAAHSFVKGLVRGKNAPHIAKQALWAMMALVSIQLISGVAMLAIGLPSLLQVFHMWLATLFLGFTLVAFTALRPERTN